MIPARRGLRGCREPSGRARIVQVLGGVLSMKRVRERSIALCAVAVVALLLSGCAAKKKPGVGAETEGMGQGGLGGGSLENFKKGVGPSEGGPLQDVHFDYDRYDLKEEDRSTLQTNAKWLRSEEHTSELQSPYDLVCRLLLRPPPRPPLFPYTTLFRSSPALAPKRKAWVRAGSAAGASRTSRRA